MVNRIFITAALILFSLVVNATETKRSCSGSANCSNSKANVQQKSRYTPGQIEILKYKNKVRKAHRDEIIKLQNQLKEQQESDSQDEDC